MGDNICKILGCSKKVNARGLCGAHYQRLRIHGDPLGGQTKWGEPMEFIKKVLTTNKSECIIWPFTKSSGYGWISVDGKGCKVHRLICEYVHGKPVGERKHALHSCGNGRNGCCNPNHLRWGTHAENMAEMAEHGNSQRGEKQWASKLTKSDVINIRILSSKGMSGKDLSKKYDVNQSCISKIINRSLWGWLK